MYQTSDAYFKDMGRTDPEAAGRILAEFVRAYEKGNKPLMERLFACLNPSQMPRIFFEGGDDVLILRLRRMHDDAMLLLRGSRKLVRH